MFSATCLYYFLEREEDLKDEEAALLLLAANFDDEIISRKPFHYFLSIEERRLRKRVIPRVAVDDPKTSLWQRMWASENDQAMVTPTGFNRLSFHYILERYWAFFHNYSPFTSDEILRECKRRTSGRKRLTDATTCLGLYLTWTRMTSKVPV